MLKPHQVFIGCPFKQPIRANYDRLKAELENETPLHLVLTDTTAISSTDYLLEHITTLIRESAGCIFDATGGNPNVSLEVGVAHALPAEFILTMYTRKPRTKEQKSSDKPAKTVVEQGELRPIISDLQGRNRIEYKRYDRLKAQLLSRYLTKLPYFRRWEDFRRRHSSYLKPALEVFREIRTSGRTVRPRVIAELDGTGIAADDLLGALQDAKLLVIKRGRAGGVYYPVNQR